MQKSTQPVYKEVIDRGGDEHCLENKIVEINMWFVMVREWEHGD